MGGAEAARGGIGDTVRRATTPQQRASRERAARGNIDRQFVHLLDEGWAGPLGARKVLRPKSTRRRRRSTALSFSSERSSHAPLFTCSLRPSRRCSLHAPTSTQRPSTAMLSRFKEKIPALESEIASLKLQIASMEPAVQAAKKIPELKEEMENMHQVANRLREDNARRREDLKDRKEDLRQLEVGFALRWLASHSPPPTLATCDALLPSQVKVANLNEEAYSLTQKLEVTLLFASSPRDAQ